ncbi:MAG: DUF992 domain-containing protein [Alphaproteobacteria bacterium]
MKGAAVALSIAVAAVAVPRSGWTDAEAEAGVSVGVLTCESVAGTRRDLIIHSSVGVECVFDTPQGKERYNGQTGVGLGLDLSWNRHERIDFAVLMASTDVRIGAYALAGKFVGGKASIAAGRGIGAAGLIGGGAKNVSLHPIAFETSTGVGIAAGLAYLFLDPAPDAE